jgi:hypothetical protein
MPTSSTTAVSIHHGRRSIRPITPENIASAHPLAGRREHAETLSKARSEGNKFGQERKPMTSGLLELLDPEVTLRVDAGPGSPLAREPIVGAEAVLAEAGRWFAPAPYSRSAIVNGVAGAVVGRSDGTVFSVVAVTVANGLITTIDFVADPAKLAHVNA